MPIALELRQQLIEQHHLTADCCPLVRQDRLAPPLSLLTHLHAPDQERVVAALAQLHLYVVESWRVDTLKARREHITALLQHSAIATLLEGRELDPDHHLLQWRQRAFDIILLPTEQVPAMLGRCEGG